MKILSATNSPMPCQLVFHIDNLYAFIDLFPIIELISVANSFETLVFIYAHSEKGYDKQLKQKFNILSNSNILYKEYSRETKDIKLLVEWLIDFTQTSELQKRRTIYISNSTHGIFSNLV